MEDEEKFREDERWKKVASEKYAEYIQLSFIISIIAGLYAMLAAYKDEGQNPGWSGLVLGMALLCTAVLICSANYRYMINHKKGILPSDAKALVQLYNFSPQPYQVAAPTENITPQPYPQQPAQSMTPQPASSLAGFDQSFRPPQ